jgi:ribosomal protein S18 acetylase RimI-like enzyme
MTTSYNVRRATVQDIAALVACRRAMFESMGIQDSGALELMCAAMATYLEQALPNGDYLGWVADAGSHVIASGGAVIHRLPPSPRNMEGREGYIMNIYTLPDWRRQGVATAIVEAILAHLKVQGIPVATLHATTAGRPVYERLGFQSTNEMRLVLQNGLVAVGQPVAEAAH